ncbi:MAG: BsuBI/PstI family type II restriction endonuclease [Polyangiales bacterium]
MATGRSRAGRVDEARHALAALGFEGTQSNELAARVLLALLGLRPTSAWATAASTSLTIRNIIDWIGDHYPPRPAENTRETVRDEVVKHFVHHGLLEKNTDDPARATTSAKTNYRVEPHALTLFRSFGTPCWEQERAAYEQRAEGIRRELERRREQVLVPVRLPDGGEFKLSAGGQSPLIAKVIEEFAPRFVPGGEVLYLGDTAGKHTMMQTERLAALGLRFDPAAKMPDVVLYDDRRKWLVIVEAVFSDGPIDPKRRTELKALFAGFKRGLVFVTAFEDRVAARPFFAHLAWETEVWFASHPEHMVHFNGERFLGPYPDTQR